MRPHEGRACVRILRAVALADGGISADEERALAVIARDVPGAADDPAEPFDLERELERIDRPELRRATFEASVALASLGGSSSEARELLRRIRASLGPGDAPDVDSAQAAWQERLRGASQRLADANVAFLHSVSRAQGAEGGLSQAAYEALVADLRRDRDAILEGALEDAAVTKLEAASADGDAAVSSGR